MLLHFVCTALLGLAASLPIDIGLDLGIELDVGLGSGIVIDRESSALSTRGAGSFTALEARTSFGVTYTINQNFSAHAGDLTFTGHFDPKDVGFYFQGDGNLVAYAGESSSHRHAVWSSGTFGHSVCADSSKCHLAFSNGNLAINVEGTTIWQTDTSDKGYAVSFMGQAPYIVVYNKAYSAIWSSDGLHHNHPSSSASEGVTAQYVLEKI